jgi:ABC-type multidrug transport system permease subunit
MHQPSAAVFGVCDRLLLLSQGQTAYDGKIGNLQAYFDTSGFSVPLYMNPAEFALDFVNTDFARDESEVEQQLEMVRSSWQKSVWASHAEEERAEGMRQGSFPEQAEFEGEQESAISMPAIAKTLIQRSFIKSYRDVVTYNIRIVMYLALALMMGTVWLRLEATEENIQSFINAIFFGGAFMSFMAVAYIPAFLEDYVIYVREHADGLYGPTPFLIANFLIGLPYLFVISLLFSIIAYWLSNFRSGAGAFFTWTAWLFLDLIVAESLVVLIASLVPIFVVALAGTAFINGLWMCTGGFLVPSQNLNPFWRYVFHYIDYQSYVFQGMMVNEFGKRNYTCPSAGDGTCSCSYRSELADQCLVEGNAVLNSYGYGGEPVGRSVAIMFAIIVAYRGLGWLVLYLRAR